MDDLANTWVADDAFDEAVAAFRSIDGALWRLGSLDAYFEHLPQITRWRGAVPPVKKRE